MILRLDCRGMFVLVLFVGQNIRSDDYFHPYIVYRARLPVQFESFRCGGSLMTMLEDYMRVSTPSQSNRYRLELHSNVTAEIGKMSDTCYHDTVIFISVTNMNTSNSNSVGRSDKSLDLMYTSTTVVLTHRLQTMTILQRFIHQYSPFAHKWLNTVEFLIPYTFWGVEQFGHFICVVHVESNILLIPLPCAHQKNLMRKATKPLQCYPIHLTLYMRISYVKTLSLDARVRGRDITHYCNRINHHRLCPGHLYFRTNHAWWDIRDPARSLAVAVPVETLMMCAAWSKSDSVTATNGITVAINERDILVLPHIHSPAIFSACWSMAAATPWRR